MRDPQTSGNAGRGQPYHGNINGVSYAFVIHRAVGPSGIAFLGDEGKVASTGKPTHR